MACISLRCRGIGEEGRGDIEMQYVTVLSQKTKLPTLALNYYENHERQNRSPGLIVKSIDPNGWTTTYYFHTAALKKAKKHKISIQMSIKKLLRLLQENTRRGLYKWSAKKIQTIHRITKLFSEREIHDYPLHLFQLLF